MPYEKKDNVWISITIERGLGLTEYSRTTYTGFDLISDVGGLQGFTVGFLAFVVSVWNSKYFDNTMATNLFKRKSKNSPDVTRN
mmetsp:Transcript_7918/g.9119  ORF Transcript_7918/g.9119 Transcript_7918/m.9119 type:complete len:84 (+) Transcript_7918:74-325(+)